MWQVAEGPAGFEPQNPSALTIAKGINKKNIAQRQCFSATRPRTDAAVWGAARVFSGEIMIVCKTSK